eukprot:2759242-Pyramimonas_sp.AAC.1
MAILAFRAACTCPFIVSHKSWTHPPLAKLPEPRGQCEACEIVPVVARAAKSMPKCMSNSQPRCRPDVVSPKPRGSAAVVVAK